MNIATDLLKDAIIAGNQIPARELTLQLVAAGVAARAVLDDGLLAAMDVVGARMRDGECFIPEVLLSARTMQACLGVVKPCLIGSDADSRGSVVMGTVEGDVHDIGKDLVAMLLEGAGFSVVNVGVGVSPSQFVGAVRDHAPSILGMSGLLTTTIPKMGETIAQLRREGLRSSVKVLVGGAPVTQEFADRIGADGYGANAAVAVELARALAARKAAVS